MFWNNFIDLCTKSNTTPTAVVNELKIGGGSVTKWKKGSIPRDTTLKKIANYFGVSTESLLNWPEEQKKNDIQADIILKMRVNEKFYSIVAKLSKLDDAKLDALSQMLDTFLE